MSAISGNRWGELLNVDEASQEHSYLSKLREQVFAKDEESEVEAAAASSHPDCDSSKLLRILKRRSYYCDDDAQKLRVSLPFLHIEDFNKHLDEAILTLDVRKIVHAMNSAIGVSSEKKNLIIPPRYTPGIAIAGWGRLLKIEQLSVATRKDRYPAGLIEFRPRTIELDVTVENRAIASLTISQVLYEMLMQARAGFLPVTRSQKDYLTRLGGFYDQINNLSHSVAGKALILFSNGSVQLKIDRGDGHVRIESQ